ncbi:RidA family protein [Botrimarina hoheduenensis]|uniref:Endoribonuclease L-PSP n=1 Tax=Botrimarina hoheduenensis TaxID=2528000 RepID=A0A5C5W9D0_9BACT|nr:RidA family protein [Botrimarina hoheduenensis]TWT47270.1 Endoribonuclease L-PSP [Botrimarina hoheduenensis]
MSHEQRLADLGIELPAAPAVMGLYRPVIVVEGFATTSGHGPLKPDGKLMTGRVGADLDTAAGAEAARLTGLAMLASLRATLGSLDRIDCLVKTLGLVQATPEFTQHPAVINGFSELMSQVFGDQQGVAARSAFGVASLPAGMAVEIEAVFRVHPA